MAYPKKIWIEARAFPYNEANDHNETILPGAFEPGKEIFHPDLVPFGIDPEIWKESIGPEKSGYNLPLPMKIMHWDDVKPGGAWTELRDTPEGMFAYGYVDSPKAIEAVKTGLLPEVSITYVDGGARDARVNIFKRLFGRGEEYMPHYVKAARLEDISLVTRGSFKGTEIKIVKEED